MKHNDLDFQRKVENINKLESTDKKFADALEYQRAIFIHETLGLLPKIDMLKLVFSTDEIYDIFDKLSKKYYMSYEIIYDTSGNIISFVELDSISLVKEISGANGDYKTMWRQYNGTSNERVLYDSQVLQLNAQYLLQWVDDFIVETCEDNITHEITTTDMEMYMLYCNENGYETPTRWIELYKNT